MADVFDQIGTATPVQTAAPASGSGDVFDQAAGQKQSAAPVATIGPSTQADSDLTARVISGGNPVDYAAARLTIPAVKALLRVHDAIKSAENLTEAGRQAHPIEAKLGDMAAAIEGLLIGQTNRPDEAIGSGQYGIATNPATAPLIPTGEGSTVGSDIVEGIPKAASDIKAAITGAKAASKSAQGIAEATEPLDAVVSKNANKMAGLVQGNTAVTAEQAPTAASTSPAVQESIRQSFNRIASSNNLKTLPGDVPISDLGEQLGDQFYSRSKSIFAKVQQVTGLDLNKLHDQIGILDDKISDAIDNPEKAGILEQQKIALEEKSASAFAKFKQETGIDPTQAEQDWKKYNSSYDIGKKIQQATSGRPGIGTGEITDAQKLAPRLSQATAKVSATRPGRLVELAGPQEANGLADAVEGQRSLIKGFEPSSATGRQALQEIIRRNTAIPSDSGAGIVGRGIRIAEHPVASITKTPITDWNGVVSDFDEMGVPERRAAFGSDVSKVNDFIRSQATRQTLSNLAKGGIGAIAAEEAIRRIWSGGGR